MTDYEELYRLYANDVLRVSYFYLGDRDRAEDVVQDTFVKLLLNRPDLEEGKEKSWLFKVALNRCRDLWRSSWAKRVVLGSPAFELVPAPDEFAAREGEDELMRAVAALPAQQREVILLFYYQHFSITEIAGMLSLPEGTVSSRLSRARRKLELTLQEETADEIC